MIIVVQNTLYKKFEYINFRFLKQEKEKSISKIYSILLFTKGKILNKRIIGIIIKLIYIIEIYNQKYKTTTTSKYKYYNCNKIRYFKYDYKIFYNRLYKKKF